MLHIGSNIKTSLSVNMDANEQDKNNITQSSAADKNNGDNFDVSVDTNTLVNRGFNEINKISKEKRKMLHKFPSKCSCIT